MYLKPGDKIQKGDYYLNSLGQWQLSKAIGLSIKYWEFGRYFRPVLTLLGERTPQEFELKINGSGPETGCRAFNFPQIIRGN